MNTSAWILFTDRRLFSANRMPPTNQRVTIGRAEGRSLFALSPSTSDAASMAWPRLWLRRWFSFLAAENEALKATIKQINHQTSDDAWSALA